MPTEKQRTQRSQGNHIKRNKHLKRSQHKIRDRDVSRFEKAPLIEHDAKHAIHPEHRVTIETSHPDDIRLPVKQENDVIINNLGLNGILDITRNKVILFSYTITTLLIYHYVQELSNRFLFVLFADNDWAYITFYLVAILVLIILWVLIEKIARYIQLQNTIESS